MSKTKEVIIRNDYWSREDEAGGLLGIAMIVLAICSCGNSNRYAHQDKNTEKEPVKIEHHENCCSTNRFYKSTYPCLIHIR